MRRLTVVGEQVRCAALCFGLIASPPLRAEPSAPAQAPLQPVAQTKRRVLQYPHLFGALSLGRGVRFNNPYRLATQLGDTGESLSLSAAYLDLGFGMSSGRYGGLEHGAVAHLSIALQGIPQEVLSLSYIAQKRVLPNLLLYGRGGIPMIIEPDINAGLELAAGATYLFRAGLGLNAELIGSLFYGASTIEESVSTIPLLSLQVGVAIDYEVLP